MIDYNTIALALIGAGVIFLGLKYKEDVSRYLEILFKIKPKKKRK